ncbi:hypothetical protein [Pseudomonas juntendi]|uniref:MarB n=1 Tax=Pseudomonas juntendi TaxID=2666183 RepID=A0A7W2JLP1_9PSED|nr:hypothetical protein [Pseudomonas juntendi]MBA6061247.1 hypothetical protein [Pseudomonas juntendi]MBA6128351.1 hypothetical protein [Pseudomonas juntendi]
MSKPMKRSAFFLSTAMVGLLAAYAQASWANENHDQHSQKSSDATQSHGSKSKQAQGMDHDSMEGMDHGKMMESHGSEKAEAGKNGQ